MKTKLLLAFIVVMIVVAVKGQQVNYGDSTELYYGQGMFDKAKLFAEKHLADASKHSKTDSNYTVALNNLGSVYYALGKYTLALPYYEEALEIQKKTLDATSNEIAVTLQNIGNIYSALNEIALAGKYNEQALSIYRKSNSITEDYIVLLNNMGFLCTTKSEFSLARKYYLEALGCRKQLSGEESLGYALVLNNLGALDVTIGNYAEAETMHIKALEIRGKPPIKNIPDYAFSLSNLASLYTELGNYDAAEPLMYEALELRASSIGRKHPDYATSLNNLAMFYQRQRKFRVADSMFREALDIFKNSLREKHYNYISCLASIATVNGMTGNYKIADSIYNTALRILEKNGAQSGLPYAFVLKDLARNLHFMGNDSMAARLSSKAMEIYRRRVDSTYIDYIWASTNLVESLNGMHEYRKAENVLISIANSERQLLIDRLGFMSESELISFVKQRRNSSELPLQAIDFYKSNNVSTIICDNVLLFKSAALLNASGLSKRVDYLNDSIVMASWSKFKASKILLNKQSAIPFARRTVNVDSLLTVTNSYEKELIKKSKQYRDIKSQVSISWKDVKAKLDANAISIDFIRYVKRKFNFKHIDTVYYAAILVSPLEDAPIVIKLVEEQELQKALNSFAYKANASNRGNGKQQMQPSANLYKLLWQPLEKYLTNIKTVYFAPDGLLHQLAFAAIPYNKDSMLCDKYNLVQLTSARVTIKDTASKPLKTLALFGGIDYNKQVTNTSTLTTADPYAFVYQQNRSASLDSFAYLPNTKAEITDIAQKASARKMAPILFTGNHASEASFRSLSGSASPQILHFATHGFTLPDAVQQKDAMGNNVFRESDNPLMRCGLVMASGNNGWKGKASPDEDDGILTGLEISNMLLPNTQLAVLSACETGLGQINGSEGVFGLQRAFKMAGVNYVMASLWAVPDKETKEFMDIFYNYLFSGKTIRESFVSTQRAMRKKYPPYYWAAFTLVQ